MKAELQHEELWRDPQLAILPSGIAVSLRDIQYAGLDEKDGSYWIHYFDGGESFAAEPGDIAAVRAAIHRIGVPIEAPTQPGEDRDGDGELGER